MYFSCVDMTTQLAEGELPFFSVKTTADGI